MFGGYDIDIPSSLPAAAACQCVVATILKSWPSAVIQDAESETAFGTDERIPFGRLTELFVFKQSCWRDSWTALGADPSNANTMIHVLHGDTKLTLVVDDPKSDEIKAIILAVRAALKRFKSNLSVPVAAAAS